MQPLSHPQPFLLTLFSTDCEFILQAVAAGIDEIIVDWEHIGKAERQANADTDITFATTEDLLKVRQCTDAKVICRINPIGPTTFSEIDQALESGANELLIPMIRRPGEVETVLKRAQQRCGVGILVETVDILRHLRELGQMPLSRIYVGLNDLSIERHTANIFSALSDGTVEYIRAFFDIPFGFGGLTLPDKGYPLPCQLLIAEMARLNCRYSFLRRSFLRDIQGRDLNLEVPRLRQALAQAWQRSAEVIAAQQRDLELRIAEQAITRYP